MTNETLYKCPECGWIGREGKMGADYICGYDGDECWSNWIYPQCHTWWQLEDYTIEERSDDH